MVAHRWAVNQVKVRPDGRTVVSCGADGSVRVHDLTSGKELRRCLLDQDPETRRELGPQFFVLGLAPDGRTAATVCSGHPHSLVHVWDLESGRMLARQPNADQPYNGIFSLDARMLVSPRTMHDLAGGDFGAKMDGAPV